jgi:hypothetical protein
MSENSLKELGQKSVCVAHKITVLVVSQVQWQSEYLTSLGFLWPKLVQRRVFPHQVYEWLSSVRTIFLETIENPNLKLFLNFGRPLFGSPLYPSLYKVV